MLNRLKYHMVSLKSISEDVRLKNVIITNAVVLCCTIVLLFTKLQLFSEAISLPAICALESF